MVCTLVYRAKENICLYDNYTSILHNMLLHISSLWYSTLYQYTKGYIEFVLLLNLKLWMDLQVAVHNIIEFLCLSHCRVYS